MMFSRGFANLADHAWPIAAMSTRRRAKMLAGAAD
jgi:hypothetical protein